MAGFSKNKTSSVVMCKYLHGSLVFWMHALILLSLAATHYCSSWFFKIAMNYSCSNYCLPFQWFYSDSFKTVKFK